MERLNIGEVVTIEGDKEFICFHRIEDNGKSYVYMMSNFKPVEVFFAEEIIDGEQLRLEKVVSQEVKMRLMNLFKESADRKSKEPEKEPEVIKTLDGTIHKEGISPGEEIELENAGTFLCCKKMRDGDQEYLGLVSKSNLRKVVFAKETTVDGIWSVEMITDPALIQRLAQLYKANPWETIKQLFKRKPKKKN